MFETSNVYNTGFAIKTFFCSELSRWKAVQVKRRVLSRLEENENNIAKTAIGFNLAGLYTKFFCLCFLLIKWIKITFSQQYPCLIDILMP